jgi:hypothetical protein
MFVIGYTFYVYVFRFVLMVLFVRALLFWGFGLRASRRLLLMLFYNMFKYFMFYICSSCFVIIILYLAFRNWPGSYLCYSPKPRFVPVSLFSFRNEAELPEL